MMEDGTRIWRFLSVMGARIRTETDRRDPDLRRLVLLCNTLDLNARSPQELLPELELGDHPEVPMIQNECGHYPNASDPPMDPNNKSDNSEDGHIIGNSRMQPGFLCFPTGGKGFGALQALY